MDYQQNPDYYYDNNQQWNNIPPQQQTYYEQQNNYSEFAANLQFSQYSYTGQQQQIPVAAYKASAQPVSQVPLLGDCNQYYDGPIYNPALHNQASLSGSFKGESYEDEPPLLEELGINFNHITQKTFSVLNPLKQANVEVLQDTDLAGPLVFCLMLGGTLLLAGKLHFGYIYGIGLTGCISMYFLLNMMSLVTVSVTCIMSTLGYCLLPMCLLSSIAVVLSLSGLIGIVATCIAVLWCSCSASKLFVTALGMEHQYFLVAYPCSLLYGVFALLAIF